jgi:hypothetical protein
MQWMSLFSDRITERGFGREDVAPARNRKKNFSVPVACRSRDRQGERAGLKLNHSWAWLP